jgi:hypothetical protein
MTQIGAVDSVKQQYNNVHASAAAASRFGKLLGRASAAMPPQLMFLRMIPPIQKATLVPCFNNSFMLWPETARIDCYCLI